MHPTVRLLPRPSLPPQAKGDASALHIIIFDEIDAICKSRGSVRDGSGVHDTVVNQLLTKVGAGRGRALAGAVRPGASEGRLLAVFQPVVMAAGCMRRPLTSPPPAVPPGAG